MILVIYEVERHRNYRFRAFFDFVSVLKKLHPDIFIYGKGSKTYKPEKSLIDVIENDLGGNVPEVVLLLDYQFAPTNFDKISSKIFGIVTDSPLLHPSPMKYNAQHSGEIEVMFHNFLVGIDAIHKYSQIKHVVFYPSWASECFDYKVSPCEKDIDFFLSGNRAVGHYPYRRYFEKVLSIGGLNCISQLGDLDEKTIDNEDFRDKLLRSRFSPHDGGINVLNPDDGSENRMIARYPESLYAKSVIITRHLGKEMELNGYIHNKTCIIVNVNQRTEYMNQVFREIDKNHNWEEIAENGYNLIKERHSTTVRVKQFLELAL